MPLTIVIKILGATLTVFLVLAFVSLALTQRTRERIFKEDYATFRSVKVGMSEEQVRKHLGEPNKVFEKSTAPRNYYVQGYAHKERVIGNKVFI